MKRIVPMVCMAFAMHASDMTLYAPAAVTAIYRDHHGFSVQDEHGIKPIKDHFVAKELLASSPAVLKKMQECGYLKVSALSDGEYKLDYCPRGRGGGLYTAYAVWLGLKVLKYTVLYAGARSQERDLAAQRQRIAEQMVAREIWRNVNETNRWALREVPHFPNESRLRAAYGMSNTFIPALTRVDTGGATSLQDVVFDTTFAPFDNWCDQVFYDIARSPLCP